MKEDLRCSGKIYWRGMQIIDAPRDSATLPHPLPGGSASSYCGIILSTGTADLYLLSNKPRRARNHIFHASTLISEALGVQPHRSCVHIGSLLSFSYISLCLGESWFILKLFSFLSSYSGACIGSCLTQPLFWMGFCALILSFFPQIFPS